MGIWRERRRARPQINGRRLGRLRTIPLHSAPTRSRPMLIWSATVEYVMAPTLTEAPAANRV